MVQTTCARSIGTASFIGRPGYIKGPFTTFPFGGVQAPAATLSLCLYRMRNTMIAQRAGDICKAHAAAACSDINPAGTET